jgi:hypothetical protein
MTNRRVLTACIVLLVLLVLFLVVYEVEAGGLWSIGLFSADPPIDAHASNIFPVLCPV